MRIRPAKPGEPSADEIISRTIGKFDDGHGWEWNAYFPQTTMRPYGNFNFPKPSQNSIGMGAAPTQAPPSAAANAGGPEVPVKSVQAIATDALKEAAEAKRVLRELNGKIERAAVAHMDALTFKNGKECNCKDDEPVDALDHGGPPYSGTAGDGADLAKPPPAVIAPVKTCPCAPARDVSLPSPTQTPVAYSVPDFHNQILGIQATTTAGPLMQRFGFPDIV